jgi:Rrf2 family protein
MNSSRFSVSIHILTLLAREEGEILSSDYIAGSININPAMVRKELINLRKHSMIGSKEGKNGGVYLSRPPGEIYLSDIYQAVNQMDLLGKSKNKPNPHCQVGKQINTHLKNLYAEAEKALVSQLGRVTLKKFARQFD